MKQKWFETARAVAMTGVGTGPRRSFRHGAVLVKKNRVVSVGLNSMKTHPILSRFTLWPYMHAESNAIIRHGLDNCEGLGLYVVRIDRNNDYMMSKPCRACRGLIEQAGLSDTYYTDERGRFHGLHK